MRWRDQGTGAQFAHQGALSGLGQAAAVAVTSLSRVAHVQSSGSLESRICCNAVMASGARLGRW